MHPAINTIPSKGSELLLGRTKVCMPYVQTTSKKRKARFRRSQCLFISVYSKYPGIACTSF